MTRFPKIFAALYTLACALVILSVGALAQQSGSRSSFLTPWSPGAPKIDNFAAQPKGPEVSYSHSIVRLIVGGYDNGTWTAGVEIIMAPGWKTYWRVPGDAGVPSEFAWENSSNVKSAEVSWPAPNRYDDITGKSTGYKKHVVFPVKVIPIDPGKPAMLNLQLFYGICSDICIPATAELELELPAELDDPQSLELIRKFAAIVPSPDAKGVDITNLKAVSIDGKIVLAVTLIGKVDAKTDILVEGFDEAFFDTPTLVNPGLANNESSEKIYHLPIDGVENPAELAGKILKLTVLSGEIRLETSVKVN